MNIKSTMLVLALLALMGCTKENPESDCELKHADNVKFLDSSLEQVPLFSMNSKGYVDEKDSEVEVDIAFSEQTLWCLHDWECPSDKNVSRSFWAERPIISLMETSGDLNYTISYSLYASLNLESPLNYSDILDIGILQNSNDEEVFFKLVVDSRNDVEVIGHEFEIIQEYSAGEAIYHDVFVLKNEIYEIFYSHKEGVVELRNLKTDESLVIK